METQFRVLDDTLIITGTGTAFVPLATTAAAGTAGFGGSEEDAVAAGAASTAVCCGCTGAGTWMVGPLAGITCAADAG